MQNDGNRILSDIDIATMESFVNEYNGYYGKMLNYLRDLIKKGIESKKFTEKEAKEDVEIALWYAYACNNLDDYEHYYMAVQWMKDSEKNAKGSGTWYYRYASALIYCGKIDEALKYAEQGVKEEPDYPWGWLQLGRLRSHFGDKKGAMEAVEKGLELEPGDYEFLTLKEDIEKGRTLPEMEYHYINSENDQDLQNDEDNDIDSKKESVNCILVDENGLKKVKKIFDKNEWEIDAPFCSVKINVQGREVECVFRMNTAYLSKMDHDWIKSQKNNIENNNYPLCISTDKIECDLVSMVFYRDNTVELIYHVPKKMAFFPVHIPKNGKNMKITVDELEKIALELTKKKIDKQCR